MPYRLGTTVTLCGAVVLALGGCDDEPAPESASAGTSSTGAVGTSSTSSSSSGSVGGSSTGSEFTSSSSEGGSSSEGDSSSEGGGTDDTVGASDSDTEDPVDEFDCESLGGVLITEFQADFPVFAVGGIDVLTAPLGTICMFPTDTSWALRLQFGPMEGPDWTSVLRIQVADAATYDLSGDFGEQGIGAGEPNALSYSLQEGASASEFDTSNQAADGTLQVDDWPVVSGNAISIRGDGNIAGVDGWLFQFSISAVLP